MIARGHPVDVRAPSLDATPLGYALNDCFVGKRHSEGEFAPRGQGALVEAGSSLRDVKYPTNNAAVGEVLRAYM